MTFREKLQKEHPDRIDVNSFCGCYGCPYTYGYESIKDRPCNDDTSSDDICTKCWDREIPGTEPTYKITPDNHVDLHKIIDDAMEKKDRYVTVFVSNEGHMTVNVYPMGNSKPRWIKKYDGDMFAGYVCSECGMYDSCQSPYCPSCGEKLAIADDKKENENEHNT